MPNFNLNDKRAASRAEAAGGVSLSPSSGHPFAASVTSGITAPRTILTPDNDANVIAAEVGRNRKISQRTGSVAGGTPNINFATGRPRDPIWYWQNNNMPYDVNKPEELERIRSFMRILYMTHPVFASATDIFSKYPLTGMEFSCKDTELTDFYTSLFFDQLDYEEFLLDVGREYWTVGEAWPYGSWNEKMGVWEDDELLNPDDIDIHRTPFSKDPFFTMRLPLSIRDVLKDRQPAWEYNRLVQNYPELLQYMDDRKRMPVSNILLKQLKFKADTFNLRGVPIGMRAIRAITQEEMMMSAQDAVADRLYTPLILAKLGASASDLGTPEPWLPTSDQLDNFEASIDAALSGDFRLMVHNFAVSIETVFGREQMPNLTQDFDRLTERVLQTWGLSQTMLSGGGAGETYAADALNRDLITQLLSTFQKKLINLYKDRAYIVAEAQQHFDYEVRGGKRYPIMEEVWVTDEETGEGHIEEQPKLLIPDLHMRTMNMKSEEAEHEFYEALRAMGVPISMKTRLTNVPIDIDDEIQKTHDEQVQLGVADIQVKKDLYIELKKQNLPIPPEVAALFDPKVSNASEVENAAAGGANPAAAPMRMPQIGVDDATSPALSPTTQELSLPPGTPLSGEETNPEGGGVGMPNNVTPLPRNRALPLVDKTRPPESDEMRDGMPRAGSKFGDPAHLGTRRFAGLNKDVPMDGETE